MYNICCKLDEKWTGSFEEGLVHLNELNINNIEIDDSIDSIDLIAMDGAQIEKYRNLLIKYNKKVVLLNSSIALTKTENYRLLFMKALRLKVECIKISLCSNWMEATQLEEIVHVLRMGKSFNIRCTIEYDVNRFDDLARTPLLNLCKQFDLKLIFNPLEIVRQKKHPFFNVFYNCKFKNNIHFLRINDGLFISGAPIEPGNGNAEVKELVSALTARNYEGYFLIESYMNSGDIDNSRIVLDRLKAILTEI